MSTYVIPNGREEEWFEIAKAGQQLPQFLTTKSLWGKFQPIHQQVNAEWPEMILSIHVTKSQPSSGSGAKDAADWITGTIGTILHGAAAMMNDISVMLDTGFWMEERVSHLCYTAADLVLVMQWYCQAF